MQSSTVGNKDTESNRRSALRFLCSIAWTGGKMSDPADICPRPQSLPPLPTRPHAPPIFPASVWECDSPQQADSLLAGREVGYVYQRDGHPNSYLLAEKLK